MKLVDHNSGLPSHGSLIFDNSKIWINTIVKRLGTALLPPVRVMRRIASVVSGRLSGRVVDLERRLAAAELEIGEISRRLSAAELQANHVPVLERRLSTIESELPEVRNFGHVLEGALTTVILGRQPDER